MCRAGGEAAQGLTMRGTQTIIYYDRSSLSGGGPRLLASDASPFPGGAGCLSSSHSAACGGPGLSGLVSGAPLTFHVFLSSFSESHHMEDADSPTSCHSSLLGARPAQSVALQWARKWDPRSPVQ